MWPTGTKDALVGVRDLPPKEEQVSVRGDEASGYATRCCSSLGPESTSSVEMICVVLSECHVILGTGGGWGYAKDIRPIAAQWHQSAAARAISRSYLLSSRKLGVAGIVCGSGTGTRDPRG